MTGPVLVTGAAGFAGRHLVEHLDASGVPVVGWRRQDADLLDRDAVRTAIAALKPASVFHLAGLPHVGESFSDPTRFYATNVLGTHHLLDALRRADVAARVVVTGSAHVYAPQPAPITEDDAIEPASPYAVSKVAQEQMALRAGDEDGLEVIVARSFNHTGPRQIPTFFAPGMAKQIALIERGKAEPVIRVGNLDPIRDLADVRDIVRAYVAMMESGRPGAVYNVASGVGRTVRSMLDALVARSKVPVRIEPDPARMRASDTPILIGDATRLRQDTGWEPQISFEQMMEDLLEYWRTAA